MTLTVTNAKRSLEFYQRLFGLPVVATQGPVPIMRLGAGPQFIALSERPTAKLGIHHVCLTIQGFEVDRVMKTLAGFGVMPAEPGFTGGLAGGPLRARVRMRGENAGGAKEGTPRSTSPTRTASSSSCRRPPTAAAPVFWRGLLVSPGRREAASGDEGDEPRHARGQRSQTSLEFYRRVFGLPVVAMQGPSRSCASAADRHSSR